MEVMGQEVCISVCCFHIISHSLPVLVFMMHILPNRITCVFELLLFLYTGGGSLGAEIERHIGGGDGYVVIEKVRANFVFLYEGASKQTVTAPKAGRYTITAVGAKGGNCLGSKIDTCKREAEQNVGQDFCATFDAQFNEGGYGALARGTFLLSAGDEIDVVVAGSGRNCENVRLYGIEREQVDYNYLQAYTGGGGGGASSATVKRAEGGGDELLLIAGGGGGGARFFPGEDGETGPNGGWDWGGIFGGGGTIPLRDGGDSKRRWSGGGGGGIYGAGGSMELKDGSKDGPIITQGGFSLSNGSDGGSLDLEFVGSNYKIKPGGHGGFGSGGQGGACE